MRHLKPLTFFFLLFSLFAFPSLTLAHGGGEHEASTLAGPLSWGFMAFGIGVIFAVFYILLTGQRSRQATAVDFDALTGFSGYIAKMRLFSRNARLYMVHVVGMDLI